MEEPEDIWDRQVRKIKKIGLFSTFILDCLLGLNALTFAPLLSLVFFASAFVVLDYYATFVKRPKQLPQLERSWKFWRKKKVKDEIPETWSKEK